MDNVYVKVNSATEAAAVYGAQAQCGYDPCGRNRPEWWAGKSFPYHIRFQIRGGIRRHGYNKSDCYGDGSYGNLKKVSPYDILKGVAPLRIPKMWGDTILLLIK